jgi:hypothetical protein
VSEGKAPFSLGASVVIKETDRAVLVRIADADEPVWIPKSVIHDDSEAFDDLDNREGDLIVHAWWAEANGFA